MIISSILKNVGILSLPQLKYIKSAEGDVTLPPCIQKVADEKNFGKKIPSSLAFDLIIDSITWKQTYL